MSDPITDRDPGDERGERRVDKATAELQKYWMGGRGDRRSPLREPEREAEEVEALTQVGFVAGYRGGYHDGASGNHEDPEMAWEDYYSALPWVQDERARQLADQADG